MQERQGLLIMQSDQTDTKDMAQLTLKKKTKPWKKKQQNIRTI